MSRRLGASMRAWRSAAEKGRAWARAVAISVPAMRSMTEKSKSGWWTSTRWRTISRSAANGSPVSTSCRSSRELHPVDAGARIAVVGVQPLHDAEADQAADQELVGVVGPADLHPPQAADGEQAELLAVVAHPGRRLHDLDDPDVALARQHLLGQALQPLLVGGERHHGPGQEERLLERQDRNDQRQFVRRHRPPYDPRPRLNFQAPSAGGRKVRRTTASWVYTERPGRTSSGAG